MMGRSSSSPAPCAATPGDVAVQEFPDFGLSSEVHLFSIDPSTTLALRFTVSLVSYPYGFGVYDALGGYKTYSVSRCPGGTDSPLDGQDGTISVNGDATNDSCINVGSAHIRYVDANGVYFSDAGLAAHKTCFIPSELNGVPATYYLNIRNRSASTTAATQLSLTEL